MSTVALATDDTEEPTPTDEQWRRLRAMFALRLLTTIAENMRETARILGLTTDEEQARQAQKAVDLFSEAETMFGQLVERL